MEYGDCHFVAGFGASPNQNLGDMHTARSLDDHLQGSHIVNRGLHRSAFVHYS